VLAAIDGRVLRDRVARYRKVAAVTPTETRGCHVLFVSSRDAAAAAIGMQRVHPVLTIGDVADFAVRGGVIGLVRHENRISFEINRRAARDSGLDIGAPLLELATVVD